MNNSVPHELDEVVEYLFNRVDFGTNEIHVNRYLWYMYNWKFSESELLDKLCDRGLGIPKQCSYPSGYKFIFIKI